MSGLFIVSSFSRSLPSALLMAIGGIVIQKSLRRMGLKVNIAQWQIWSGAIITSFGVIVLFGSGRINSAIAFTIIGVAFILGIISLFIKNITNKKDNRE